ncbi:CD1375 family protein [Paenibacillus senegalimassiliensis]|nr:CD1375 family protein [Paenibacillus senegalimassiliensis]
MTYTKDSGLVKVWFSLVKAGAYTLEQVPELFNLKVVITEIINDTSEY